MQLAKSLLYIFIKYTVHVIAIQQKGGEKTYMYTCKIRAVTMVRNQGFLPATRSVKLNYSDRKLNIKDLKNLV